jgi:hypothetical protein
VHSLRHPSGRNPDSAPRPMLPLYDQQSIYAPRALARQEPACRRRSCACFCTRKHSLQRLRPSLGRTYRYALLGCPLRQCVSRRASKSAFGRSNLPQRTPLTMEYTVDGTVSNACAISTTRIPIARSSRISSMSSGSNLGFPRSRPLREASFILSILVPGKRWDGRTLDGYRSDDRLLRRRYSLLKTPKQIDGQGLIYFCRASSARNHLGHRVYQSTANTHRGLAELLGHPYRLSTRIVRPIVQALRPSTHSITVPYRPADLLRTSHSDPINKHLRVGPRAAITRDVKLNSKTMWVLRNDIGCVQLLHNLAV